MIVLLLIPVLVAVGCGIAAGARGLPVPLGILLGVVASILGMIAAGFVGSVAFGLFVLACFCFIPLKKPIGPESHEIPCPECGRIVADTTRFCPRCMTDLSSSTRDRNNPSHAKPDDGNPYAPPSKG